jgi:hypothetical protein
MTFAAIEVLPFLRSNFLDAITYGNITRAQADRHGGARYLFNYLTAIGAKSIVVENEYIDADYLDDFANYYVRAFESFNRRCRRLHFFDELFDVTTLTAELTSPSGASEKLRGTYLGFIVVRPLPTAIIGRTVLRTYASDHGRRNYTAIRDYTVHLYGSVFTVRSLAFQQQDTVLAACATVSLWSAFHKTSKLFSTIAPSPAVITAAATSSVFEARPLPSRGLTLAQMTRAVRHTGLEPEVIECGPGVPLVSLIHSYLEFGLPVVVGITVEGVGGHAITISGYSIQQNRVSQSEDESAEQLYRSGLRINEFYAHDDGVGPFARIVVKTKPSDDKYPSCIYFEGEWLDEATQKPLRLLPVWVIVPVYHKIRLTFLDIQKWVIQYNSFTNVLLSEPTKAEWNTALANANDFKQEIRASSLSEETRTRLLLTPLPRFLWRTTLVYDGAPLVELVFDATGIEQSMPLLEVLYYDAEFGRFITPAFSLPGIASVMDEHFAKFLAGVVTQ